MPNYIIAVIDETLVITGDDPHIAQFKHFGIVQWNAGSLKEIFKYPTFNIRSEEVMEKRCTHRL